jgi:ppGpp synthetase/RelA/SpoT-type nucleotidyltranferase
MSKEISKTQVDRLGDRIKRGHITEEDLRLLDRYRRTFTPAYEVVVGAIRDKLGLEPTGRPAKSTISIIDKLKRESIRLTQIQDIAGCRIIVFGIPEQESAIQSLTSLFPQTNVIDRRVKPSHGYRAVHVVVNCDGKSVEVQVRTTLQHVWAEVSEKLSDIRDPSIKYGGGNIRLQKTLQRFSELVAELPSKAQLSDDAQMKLAESRKRIEQYRQQTDEILDEMIDGVSNLKEEPNDISD